VITSPWGAIGLAELAYFKMINDRGGIGDAGSNSSASTRRSVLPRPWSRSAKLVEQDGVAFIYGSVGPGNLAIRKYLNDQRMPHWPQPRRDHVPPRRSLLPSAARRATSPMNAGLRIKEPRAPTRRSP
jgi:hypothetical protein